MKQQIVFTLFVSICSCRISSADHLPPVDPIVLGADHSHEDHSGHEHSDDGPSTQGANLSHANFTDSTFANSLTDTDLTEAVFERAFLPNVQATGATLRQTSFKDAVWPLGRIAETTVDSVNFSGAIMTNHLFRNIQFVDTIFQDADLTLSHFVNASLANTDLRGANLSGANLTGATLSQTRFDGETTYDRFTRFPEGFDPVAAGLTLTETRLPDTIGNVRIFGEVAGFTMNERLIGIAYDPSSATLLGIQSSDGRRLVKRLSTTGQELEQLSSPLANADAIDLLPNGNWLLASEEEEKMVVYDPVGRQILSEIDVDFDEFEGWAFDPARNTAFATEDDGLLKEISLDGEIVNCCFGTAEHENLAYDANSGALIAIADRLDFLAPNGETIRSVPVTSELIFPAARSIDVDESNRLLYALYLQDGFTTVRVFDLHVVPEPSPQIMALLGVLGVVLMVKIRRPES